MWSTQCNVTWQTSSEYCWLPVPSGTVLNYVSFAWKIKILEIFGFPPRSFTASNMWHIPVKKEFVIHVQQSAAFDNHNFNLYPDLSHSDSGVLQWT